jgi:hypothetical protein
VLRRLTGKERGAGSGKLYTIEETAQRLEFEVEKQRAAYAKKRHRLTPERRIEWQQEIDGLQRTIDLLRREPRLCAMDLRISANPAALATFERGHPPRPGGPVGASRVRGRDARARLPDDPAIGTYALRHRRASELQPTAARRLALRLRHAVGADARGPRTDAAPVSGLAAV